MRVPGWLAVARVHACLCCSLNARCFNRAMIHANTLSSAVFRDTSGTAENLVPSREEEIVYHRVFDFCCPFAGFVELSRTRTGRIVRRWVRNYCSKSLSILSPT